MAKVGENEVEAVVRELCSVFQVVPDVLLFGAWWRYIQSIGITALELKTVTLQLIQERAVMPTPSHFGSALDRYREEQERLTGMKRAKKESKALAEQIVPWNPNRPAVITNAPAPPSPDETVQEGLQKIRQLLDLPENGGYKRLNEEEQRRSGLGPQGAATVLVRSARQNGVTRKQFLEIIDLVYGDQA